MASSKKKTTSTTDAPLLRIGVSDGVAVRALQKALLERGFSPGNVDGQFGLGTQSAVMAFQYSEGLLADGIVGPRTQAALDGEVASPLPSAIERMSVDVVSQMFPHTPLGNIKSNLPYVLASLERANLQDRLMVLAALSTIRAETESFEPIAEGQSRYNTSPNGHPFDLYDSRKDLGNQGPPDGERFRGRGFVQLTGRFNYATYGKRVGLGEMLVTTPENASQPDVAGDLLAAFLGDKERPLKEALLDQDFARARRLVNGGSHGLDRFVDAYRIGARLTVE
jgi:putative chitinase